jgi:hypothetical protein
MLRPTFDKASGSEKSQAAKDCAKIQWTREPVSHFGILHEEDRCATIWMTEMAHCDGMQFILCGGGDDRSAKQNIVGVPERVFAAQPA